MYSCSYQDPSQRAIQSLSTGSVGAFRCSLIAQPPLQYKKRQLELLDTIVSRLES